jgi:hypothetical protein
VADTEADDTGPFVGECTDFSELQVCVCVRVFMSMDGQRDSLAPFIESCIHTQSYTRKHTMTESAKGSEADDYLA